MTSRDEKVYTIADMDAYRDGLNSIHAEEVASLRAQLLAARAEALEWAYDNTGLDMSFSSRHRDKAHFVRDGLAALRAKGGGK